MKENTYVLINAPDLRHAGELPAEFMSQLKKALVSILVKRELLNKDLYEQCLQNTEFCGDFIP